MTHAAPGRRVVPIDDAFFCDGPWYVLASSSLGGSGLSATDIAERLQSASPDVVRGLLADGVCLPLCFPGDCALDNAVIVVGDLTECEEREWIGRLRATLKIPCGEFLVMGGGLDEDFEVALPNAKAPDPHFVFFQKVDLEPGTYVVEVYAFLASLTANEAWEDPSEDGESIEQWWARTRGDDPAPKWIEFFREEEYVDGEEFGFLEYLIRIAPAPGAVPVPPLDEDTNWVTDFEIRKPELCPVGIPRAGYGKFTNFAV